MPPEAETLPKTAGTAMGAGRKSYPGTPDFAKDGGSAGNPVVFHNQNQFHGAQKGLLTEVRIVNGALQDPAGVAHHTDCAEVQVTASYGFRLVLTSQADSPFRNYCSVSLCWTKYGFCLFPGSGAGIYVIKFICASWRTCSVSGVNR